MATEIISTMSGSTFKTIARLWRKFIGTTTTEANKLNPEQQIQKLKNELDASRTWNKCLESAFAQDIARVNSAMMRAFQERDETLKKNKELEKQLEKLNKKQHEKPKEIQQ